MSFVSNHQPEVLEEINNPPVVVRVRKPRKKASRSIRLLVSLNAEGQNAVIQITVGKLTERYTVSRIPSDWGMGFELLKSRDGETYHVNLDGDSKTCDCKGHSRHNHCKHVDGLAKLDQLGKLTDTPQLTAA